MIDEIDEDTKKRLKLDRYLRRTELPMREKRREEKQRNLLLGIMYKYEPSLKVRDDEWSCALVEDLLELAIACANKNLTIEHIKGQDYDDQSDAKLVTGNFRNNKKATGDWQHSFIVTNIQHKTLLRICAFNPMDEQFHFFCMPTNVIGGKGDKVEIVVQACQNMPKGVEPDFTNFKEYPIGVKKDGTLRQWWDYECDSFEDMARRNITDFPPVNPLLEFFK